MQGSGKPPAVVMMELILGRFVSQSLSAAAELGLADLMKDGPMSVRELAARVGAHEDALFRLLRVLASVGVFEQVGDEKQFQLTPVGALLRTDVPGSSRDFAYALGLPRNSRAWEQLVYSVRTGKAAFDHVFGVDMWRYLADNPKELEDFNRGMTNVASTLHATTIEAYDFSGIETLVDVGGGHGRLLCTILQKYPTMRGVLFDQPHVVAGAKANVEAMGVASRCEIVGGSFFTSVPAGSDAILMSYILHDWNHDDGVAILKNCREAIRPGGRLIVVDSVLKPGNEPDLGKPMDLHMLVMFGGRERTGKEFEELFKDSGFQFRRIIPTRSPFSIVEGIAE